MRRSLPVFASLALVACSVTPPRPPVDLGGPTGLALVGGTLYVASATSSALRVIDVARKQPGYVLAPNPLAALEIPTDANPIGLTGWTDPDGTASPFLIALSAIDRSVTVVSTEQLARLGAFSLGERIPLAAVALPHGVGEDAPFLVAALDPAAGAVLLRFVLSPDLIAERERIAEDVPSAIETLLAMPGETPRALVLSPADPNLAVVALGASLALVDLTALSATTLVLPGRPDALAFEPDGTRLVGLWDLADCPISETSCTDLFVVDMATLALAPEQPVRIPGGATAIAFGGEGKVAYKHLVDDVESTESVAVERLLLVASRDGALYVFNGAAMTPLKRSDDAMVKILSASMSMPSALVHVPAKNLFFGAFLGGDLVESINPMSLVDRSSAGFSSP